MTPPLRERLRLIVITDRTRAGSRPVIEIASLALDAGAPAIQLRDKQATARQLLDMARVLRGPTREAGALLFVNDRLDVALAAGADGIHLGPDDLPVAAVRSHVPPGFLIGASTDDPDRARALVGEGADYIGCGTVYPTSSKADAGDAIGLSRLDAVARAVSAPVVAIGGIDAERSREIARTQAAGVAVIGAVMSAADPAEAVRQLLAPWRRSAV